MRDFMYIFRFFFKIIMFGFRIKIIKKNNFSMDNARRQLIEKNTHLLKTQRKQFYVKTT